MLRRIRLLHGTHSDVKSPCQCYNYAVSSEVAL